MAAYTVAQRVRIIYTKFGAASVEDVDSETESINSTEVPQGLPSQPAPLTPSASGVHKPALPTHPNLPPLSGAPLPADVDLGLGRSEGHSLNMSSNIRWLWGECAKQGPLKALPNP